MQSLEIIKHYYACFNQKNWDGMLQLLHADIRHDVNQGSARIGIEQYRKFLQHMELCYDEQLKEMVFMPNADGTRVACEFVVHGMYKHTDGDLPAANNQRYVLPAGAFLELKEGKISRVTTYYNLPEWVRQISQGGARG